MITVIDNALEDNLFQSILDIVNHNDFPWYLGNDIDDINFHKKRKNVNEKIITETSSNNNSYMPYFNLPY